MNRSTARQAAHDATDGSAAAVPGRAGCVPRGRCCVDGTNANLRHADPAGGRVLDVQGLLDGAELPPCDGAGRPVCR
jgi:hypothetical protein